MKDLSWIQPRFAPLFGEPDAEGVSRAEKKAEGPVNHLVEIHTLKSYLNAVLNIDPDRPIATLDWLVFPQQRLLALKAGKVFYDGLVP
ncbi:MAG TPA: hypothetical protein VH186_12315 [Chloroflexia bacterium]|nr:hypothetical protein [Chloroflexia bacterium]